MDSFTTNYLYEIITKCAQNELHQISLQQVKTAYASIGLKPGSKRKEELIQDIIGYLASILIKQCNGNQIREGFPLFNHNNELFLRNPHVKNLIEACNQQIHITNIQLAQLNYSRLSQAKRIVPPTTGVYKCYCDQTIDPNFLTEQVIKCINPKCGKLLHRFCMKLKQERETYPLFECPDCVLFKCDPLHQVCRILVPPFVVDNRRKDFLIDDATYRDIKTNESLAIEVRAIKLEDKSHEQCWPHNGELVLNQFKYLEFKPLQQNSSLKKRKDEKFVTTEVNCGSNSLLLKYVRGSDPRNPRAEETYIAAVYLVKRLTCEELVKKTKNENKRTLEECKKKIIDDFENSSVDIDKLVYPMTCVFDMQPLKTPAKGSHCKHPNCFSLENFVNVWQKNNQRKWNCPICKLKSYDIVVDSYFEKVMDDLKKSGFGNPSQVEVEIMRNAEFRFVKNEDNSDSEDEQKVEAKPEKQQPEKSMNLIVLDDSDEEGGSKKEKAAAAAAAEGKMSVEESSEKKKGEAHEEAMQVEAPKGAEENKPKDSGKMTVESVGDPKKTANRFSPIQINSTDTTPAKIRDSSEVDLKLLKHGTVPDPKKTPQQQQPQPQPQQPQQPQPQPQPQQIKPGQPQVPDHIQQQFQDKQKQQAYQVYTQRQQQQQQERQKFPNPYLPQQMLEFQQQHLQSAQRQNPQDKTQPPQKPGPRPTDPASLLGMASGLPQNAQNAALAKVLGQLKNNPSIPPQALNSLLPYLTNMSAKAKMANPGTRTPYDDLGPFLPAEWQKYNIGMEALLPLMRGMQDMAGYANPLRMNPGALLPQANDPLAAMGFLGGANRNPGNIHNPQNPNILNQGSFLKDNLTPKHPGVSDGSTVGASPKTPGTQKAMMTEKERHTREYSEGAEKHIEKLIDLAEHRPEIPTYETFKTKKNLEPKKVKETDYQKNKKLVGFIMKQMPLQSKGPSNKRLDDTGIMGTKHVKLNEGANINGGAMETEHPQGMNGKIQGKESDPICLD